VIRPAAVCLSLMAGAAGAECRLALALGFDVSRSVGPGDYAIQRGGLVAALADPDIRRAFLDPGGQVALAVFEWSGSAQQAVILDWSMIATAADLDAAAAVVAGHRRTASAMTALGAALIRARGMMAQAPRCAMQVLDLSGDGQNNVGPGPAAVYAAGGFEGLTVNGLAIEGEEADIARYYREQVVRGTGAFVEVARSPRDYPRAIRRKLERELTEQIVGSLPQGSAVADHLQDDAAPVLDIGQVRVADGRHLAAVQTVAHLDLHEAPRGHPDQRAPVVR
jgi:hypothetical protein